MSVDYGELEHTLRLADACGEGVVKLLPLSKAPINREWQLEARGLDAAAFLADWTQVTIKPNVGLRLGRLVDIESDLPEIQRLLPVLRSALDDLGALPERDATHFAQTQCASGKAPRLIIDATERRRQRPKNPEKQALFSSGR